MMWSSIRSNALGPYLLSKVIFDLPFIYGPALMATLLYWMTGRQIPPPPPPAGLPPLGAFLCLTPTLLR